jgi:mono/diheme cytochrome c family protein
MRHTVLVLALVFGLVPVAAHAGEATKVMVGDQVQGRRLFAIQCASCHGPGGAGGGQVHTVPPAPSLTDPARMSLVSDRQLFALIEKGGPALGLKDTMPAFGGGLSDLDAWDIVSYLGSRHLEVTDFYPDAAIYYGKAYTIDQWGAQRYQQLNHKKLPDDQRTWTVLGIYKGTQGPEGPHLVPDTPLAVAKLEPQDKVGYVAFVDAKLPGVRGTVLLGIAMDVHGQIEKVLANSTDARLAHKVDRMLETFVGHGRKDQKRVLRGHGSMRLRKAFTEIYDRAMEAVVMYDKAERERHWADSDFGGPKGPESTIEGGTLKVHNKHHRK